MLIMNWKIYRKLLWKITEYKNSFSDDTLDRYLLENTLYYQAQILTRLISQYEAGRFL